MMKAYMVSAEQVEYKYPNEFRGSWDIGLFQDKAKAEEFARANIMFWATECVVEEEEDSNTVTVSKDGMSYTVEYWDGSEESCTCIIREWLVQ